MLGLSFRKMIDQLVVGLPGMAACVNHFQLFPWQHCLQRLERSSEVAEGLCQHRRACLAYGLSSHKLGIRDKDRRQTMILRKAPECAP